MTTAGDIARAQREKAIYLYGIDTLASALPPFGETIAATSAAYALAVATSWIPRARAGVKKAIEGSSYFGDGASQLGCSALVDRILATLGGTYVATSSWGRAATTLPTEAEIKAVATCDPLAARILRDLREMFAAIKVGAYSSRQAVDGQIIMGPADARWFWNSHAGLAASIGGTTQVVTGDEKWKAFTSGAREGLRAAADTAGSAAGAVLGAAGTAIGSGVGALLEELGFVKVATIGAAGFVAWRYVL